MKNNHIYRLETKADYREVENLTRETFWNVYQPGCDEHYIIHIMRDDEDVVTALNYVCELDGRIVGHIFYTHTKIVDHNNVIHPVLSFGPISVHPDVQKTGIGSSLIKKTMNLAAEMGFKGIVITGNPQYYHRFGFKAASEFGIVFEDGSSFPELMAIELIPGGLANVNGRIHFAQKFSNIDPEKLARFDSQFPKKEKKNLPSQLW